MSQIKTNSLIHINGTANNIVLDNAGNITAGNNIIHSSGIIYPSVLSSSKDFNNSTSLDFTDIPSWVTNIKLIFSGAKKSGTTFLQVQLGTSAGITTSGYTGTSSTFGATTGYSSISTGFIIRAGAAADVIHGTFDITRLAANSDVWISSGVFSLSNAAYNILTAGRVALTQQLTTIRITTTGSDNITAGTFNLLLS